MDVLDVRTDYRALVDAVDGMSRTRVAVGNGKARRAEQDRS